ncbi:acyl-CoA dehydrogenase family protein [Parendozoicomonas haliclonae]|uniref:Acyl-CoA dehydrogenase, middle domain n=1 Tax=Parendozoicomonas haliclonae TaxID=1960125 RepID=A0A1X7AED5_9GAMM|nr:acyl-CoA dehydrogenase family protein [Parendozoicomonas haliclonae]SMA32531.1 Acyl-CoA dehydrogenase, middle domain [Parendozoicomonas haliclonae]
MTNLRALLQMPVPELENFQEWKLWWQRYFSQLDEQGRTQTLEQAFVMGSLSDRFAWAFSCGYQWAIRSLLPAFQQNPGLMALCITEEKGGHPRSIHARLTADQDGYRISGHKRFVSGGSDADLLFVALNTGEEQNGRPVLKMAAVDAGSDGIIFNNMPALPMIPELAHAMIDFDNVSLSEEELLTGDGYQNYIKPFRLQEDMHVQAAVLGMLARKSQDLNQPELVETAIALFSILETCWERGECPQTHLAIGGMAPLLKNLLETFIATLPSPEEQQIWKRDTALLSIAGKARKIRLQKAREWLVS